MYPTKLYRVKTSGVKRVTVTHRVFAESGAEAKALVLAGKGERVGRTTEHWVEQPDLDAKLDKREE
jgi:hypothetical protein